MASALTRHSFVIAADRGRFLIRSGQAGTIGRRSPNPSPVTEPELSATSGFRFHDLLRLPTVAAGVAPDAVPALADRSGFDVVVTVTVERTENVLIQSPPAWGLSAPRVVR